MWIAKTKVRVSRAGLVGLLLLASGTAVAEQRKPDAAAQALRKAQGMLRDLNMTVTALQAEKTVLQEQVDKLNGRIKELEGLPEQVRQQKASLDSLQSSNEQLQGRLGAEARRFETLVAKQRETQQELGRYRQDNALLVQAVKERSQWIKTCGEKNAKMLDANKEMLQKYQDKGLWTVLANEPFTQIGSVAEENAAQDFRFKLEDLKVTPWIEPASKADRRVESGEAAEDDGE